MIDGITGLDTVTASGKGAMFNDDTARLKADVIASTPLPITIDQSDDMMGGFVRFSEDMMENVRASENPTITDLINADGNLRIIIPDGFILLANKMDDMIKSNKNTPKDDSEYSQKILDKLDEILDEVDHNLLEDIFKTALLGLGIEDIITTIAGVSTAIALGTASVTLLATGVDALAKKVMSEEKYQEMMDVQTEALKQGYIEFGGYDGATISGPQWFTDWVAKNDVQFQNLLTNIKRFITDKWNEPLVIPEDPDPVVVVPKPVADVVDDVVVVLDNSTPSGAKDAFDQGYVEFGEGETDKGYAWLKSKTEEAVVVLDNSTPSGAKDAFDQGYVEFGEGETDKGYAWVKNGIEEAVEKFVGALESNTEATITQTDATMAQTDVTALQTEVQATLPEVPPLVPQTTYMPIGDAVASQFSGGLSLIPNAGVNANNMSDIGVSSMTQHARKAMAYANPNAGGTAQTLFINSGKGWDALASGGITPYSSTYGDAVNN